MHGQQNVKSSHFFTTGGSSLQQTYTERRPLLRSSQFGKIRNQKLQFLLWDLYTDQYIILLFNVTVDTPIFTNTCILQNLYCTSITFCKRLGSHNAFL
jgi:hypothetical protein